MDLTEKLAALVTPTLEDMGYELVRVVIQGSRRQTLQIMAERADGAVMTVNDCADISRALSALLDVEDPIAGAYTLEVSSPGIDRPLTRRKDFMAWAGFDAKVEAKGLVEGRKRFSGVLKGLDEEDRVLISAEDGEWKIPLDLVSRAKLILTDALIEAVAPGGMTEIDDDLSLEEQDDETRGPRH